MNFQTNSRQYKDLTTVKWKDIILRFRYQNIKICLIKLNRYYLS